jgi:hypothetical protein
MRKKLTALILPTLPQGAYHDSGSPGLQLRVGKTRSTWSAFHRLAGKLKQTTLGHYPQMSLSDARKAAAALADAVEAGLPVEARDDDELIQNPRLLRSRRSTISLRNRRRQFLPRCHAQLSHSRPCSYASVGATYVRQRLNIQEHFRRGNANLTLIDEVERPTTAASEC